MNEQYAKFVRTLTSPRCELSRLDRTAFIDALTTFAVAASALDKFKRLLFYGVGTDRADDPPHEFEMVHSDVLHGVIGIATEAGEAVEALLKMASEPEKGAEHKTNLVEELGDLSFYKTLVANALGTNEAEITHLNIAKLRVRYDSGFSVEAAIRRVDQAQSREQSQALGAAASLRRGLW